MSADDIISRLIAGISRINLYSIRNARFSRQEFFSRIIHAATYLCERSLYIVDDTRISIETLTEIARTAVMEKQLDCILIDHFGLICNVDFTSDKYERASKKLKDLARWLNVPVVTMFQCPRDSNQREPSLADVPCTMNWLADDSDVILFLHRHKPQIEAEHYDSLSDNEDVRALQSVKIIIEKNRNGETGYTFAGFNGSTASFENIEQIL